jgi:hypothetical protein
MHSRNGPGIAVSDVDGDGLEDFYVGGAAGHSGGLFFQEQSGKFRKGNVAQIDSLCDQMGVLFFDADNDGDNDLYIVSGGTEQPKDSPLYKDHFYVNDGKGNFTEVSSALPEMRQSGSCVVAADYDKDGDLDLFVGGRILPGEYPMPADSYILRNDSKRNAVAFTDVTKSLIPSLTKSGLVTGALWTDVDNDGWIDLLIVGEFMPVTCYKNQEGKSFARYGEESFAHTSGWWNSLTGGDFDNDGDTDYIAGNLGLNTRYQGNEKEPLCIYASDFDKSGSIDPVMALYIQGEKEIAHSWDDMVKQMNPIRARFRTYQPYAEAPFNKSFLQEELDAAYKVCAENFQSSYIENLGNGNFAVRPLQVEAQFSPAYGIISEDYNGDGFLDVMLVGNSYATEVSTGRYDASIGLLLAGNGMGDFKTIDVRKSGFVVDKDAKGLAKLLLKDGRELILSCINDGKLKVHITSTQHPVSVSSPDSYRDQYHPSHEDIYAIVKLKNGITRRHEFYYGSTYLSQSGRALVLTDDMVSFIVFDSSGKKKIIR